MDLGGEWLDHRPGQLLKYLICARGRRVPADELVEMLWPGAGARGSPACVRASTVFAIGSSRIARSRRRRASSSARPNAYELNTASTVVDADEFEREATLPFGPRSARGGRGGSQLANAAQLYRGEFLAEEPYAEWAFRERGRLRDLAARVLRALAETYLQAASFRPRRARCSASRTSSRLTSTPSATSWR